MYGHGIPFKFYLRVKIVIVLPLKQALVDPARRGQQVLPEDAYDRQQASQAVVGPASKGNFSPE